MSSDSAPRTGIRRLGKAGPAEELRRLTGVPELDGLRGIAVLLVVIVHFRYMLAPWSTRYVYAPLLADQTRAATGRSMGGWILIARPDTSWIANLMLPRGGVLGVDIFFVLSGFLITALLLGEQASAGRVAVVAFFRRRALRLIPALLVYLAAQATYAAAIGVSWSIERRSIMPILLYYFNWHLIDVFPLTPPALGHLWSLSIEEQFYWVWPFITMIALGVRRRAVTIAVALGGLVVAGAIWRIILVQSHDPAVLGFRTDARADSLLVGALAAHLWVRRKTPPHRFLAIAAWPAAALVTFTVIRFEPSDRFFVYGGRTLVAVAVATIMLAAIDTDWRGRRVLSFAPLRVVGRVSYGLYLWHLLAFVLARQMRTSHSALRMASGLALAATATVVSWYVIERPFLRWKVRLDAGDRSRIHTR